MPCLWQEECGWQHGSITEMILKHKQRQGFLKIKSDLDSIRIALIATIKGEKTKLNSAWSREAKDFTFTLLTNIWQHKLSLQNYVEISKLKTK